MFLKILIFLLFDKGAAKPTFQFCFEAVNCTSIIYLFMFADQELHINEKKSRLFMIFEM